MIPMPIFCKENLCLSIIKLSDGNYSVMAAELIDKFGNPAAAECCLHYPCNEEGSINSILLPEYGCWKGPDLEEVIRRACIELENYFKK